MTKKNKNKSKKDIKLKTKPESNHESDNPSQTNPRIGFIRGYSIVENFAEHQVYEMCKKYPQIDRVIVMPDIHPGPGIPIGVAFRTINVCFPKYIGTDIGCGMTLFNISNSNVNKFNPKRIIKKLEPLDLTIPYDSIEQIIQNSDLESTEFDSQLGSIGGGNHFAEFLMVEKVRDPDAFKSLDISEAGLLLLVHSGSRGYGCKVLDDTTKEMLDTPNEINDYMQRHDRAVDWALANRMLIAHRLCEQLGFIPKKILNIIHNYLQKDGSTGYIHRKGVGYVKPGQISIIPGSRGTFTYLVQMTSDPELNEFSMGSIAHGAGRRFNRGVSKEKFSKKYPNSELLRQTKLGSSVICKSKTLLYQEVPEAYKDIDTVISDLESWRLITVVAVLRPLLTFKS